MQEPLIHRTNLPPLCSPPPPPSTLPFHFVAPSLPLHSRFDNPTHESVSCAPKAGLTLLREFLVVLLKTPPTSQDGNKRQLASQEVCQVNDCLIFSLSIIHVRVAFGRAPAWLPLDLTTLYLGYTLIFSLLYFQTITCIHTHTCMHTHTHTHTHTHACIHTHIHIHTHTHTLQTLFLQPCVPCPCRHLFHIKPTLIKKATFCFTFPIVFLVLSQGVVTGIWHCSSWVLATSTVFGSFLLLDSSSGLFEE